MESHFISPDKLQKASEKKIEADVVKAIQNYAEKMLTDIINRSALLAAHNGSETIDVSEISIVVEKDFDFSCRLRTILEQENNPSNEHIEKIAEISRQKY